MVVPLVARYIAAVVGLLLVLTAARSVIGTVIVPRAVASWLTQRADQLVKLIFAALTARIDDYHRRDRMLAGQAAALLICQLLAWLLLFFVGFSLMFWPLVHGGITSAFATAGDAVWAIGNAPDRGAAERALLDIAALSAVITVTLQISYLPALYAAFNHRETDVALLNARAGVPSWGPELLARTHYALGSGVSTISTLPEIYADWERWAADVAESHTTYLPLVRFRSSRPLSSWVISLLAILDSAALLLALSPSAVPAAPVRLCLRSGFVCLNEIARTMGFDIPDEPGADSGIAITYEEFEQAVTRMRKVDFPIERDPRDAWPDFVGWRVNYEQAAYAIAREIDAVPALWSGPRRVPIDPIPPFRPPQGRLAKEQWASDPIVKGLFGKGPLGHDGAGSPGQPGQPGQPG